MTSDTGYVVSPITGRGYVLLERGLRDMNIFKKPDEYNEYEAFLYLLENAAYEAKTDFVNGLLVELQRGQLVASLRYLKDAWGWKKDRVSTFLKKMEKVGWIKCTTDYKEISDNEPTPNKKPYNRRPTLIDVLVYDVLQRTNEDEGDENQDSFPTESPTTFSDETDKPKINQFNHSDKSKIQNPGGSADKTLMEAFPDALTAETFVNVVPQKWHTMPIVDLKWGVEKIEYELKEFWHRYSGLGKGKKTNLEKRMHWYGVWREWCNQDFRNG